MKRLVFLCVVIAVGCTTAFSQQRKLDSLFNLNRLHPQEDSLKAIYLREIFRGYASMRNYPKADLYIDSAIQVASHLPNKAILAQIYNRAGGVYHNQNRLRAITYYNLCLSTARANNVLITAANVSLNLGALYMDIKDFPKSLEAHEAALQAFAQLKDEGGMSSCYMNMSNIYQDMGQPVKAMEYIRKSLKVFEAAGSDRGIAVADIEIAVIYFAANNNELAEMGIQSQNRNKEIGAVLDKGLSAALKTDDVSLIANGYSLRGKLNEQQGNLTLAKQDYDKALSILNGDLVLESFSDDYISAGNFYINQLKETAKGFGMLQMALVSARKLREPDSEKAALIALSDGHEKLRNFDSSLFYFRQAIIVKDSIFSKEKEQEITRRQLKIDFDIKERDYKNAQQLADARMKQQEQQILLRNQQLLISDKEKTLQRLTFLQKQAELESQKKLQANELRQEQQKAEYDKNIRDQQISVQGLQLTANKRVSIFLGAIAVIVITVAMFIYNSRKKTIRLNRIVSEQKVELEELVAVKDKIFSVVSHDMRAPVNDIIAFSSLLEEGDIEQERLARYVEQIKGTLDHTSSMMENLLNWAASQMQGFAPIIENVNIAPMIQQILQGSEPSLQRKKIGVENHIYGDVIVKGDMNMIELILRNIIGNAIKFSNHSGRLGLSVTQEKNATILSISDSGVGIDDRKVAIINSESRNAIQSTTGTGKERGTGLGLMLCKHFAALMQGKIYAESTPGRGSIFNIMLPNA